MQKSAPKFWSLEFFQGTIYIYTYMHINVVYLSSIVRGIIIIYIIDYNLVVFGWMTGVLWTGCILNWKHDCRRESLFWNLIFLIDPFN